MRIGIQTADLQSRLPRNAGKNVLLRIDQGGVVPPTSAALDRSLRELHFPLELATLRRMPRPRDGASTSPASPLLAFLCDTLLRSGCEVLKVDGDKGGFFRLAFEDPLLQRSGLFGRLFRLLPHDTNGDGARMTLRPPASPDDARRGRDPFRVFTSVLLGVDPARGLFVAFDPARHFPEDAPLRVSISAEMVRTTLDRGWHGWLREGWEERDFDFAEALVGFRSDRLFHYVLFERIAEGLDTPYRERLTEEFLDLTRGRPPAG